MSRSILITGAGGHLGAALARRLVANENRVFAAVRPGSTPLRLKEFGTSLTIVEADVTDGAALIAAVRRAEPDAVVHLASSLFNPPAPLSRHLAVNVGGAANLVEALEAFPQAPLIYASSAAIYGSASRVPEDGPLAPATWLGATKAGGGLVFAAHARMTGRPVTELRIYTPYGPGERNTRLIPHLILSVLDGRPIRTTEGRQQRDFLYIDDMVELMMRVLDSPRPGHRAYNAGYGRGVPVREVVTTVLERMGALDRAEIGAIPTRADEIMEMVADISLAERELGWRPATPLGEGLTRTVQWATSNTDILRRLT